MREIVSTLLAATFACIVLGAGPGYANDGPCKPDETVEECNDRYAFPPIDTGDYTLEQLAGMSDDELVALSETIDPKIAKNLRKQARREALRHETSILMGVQKDRAYMRRQNELLEACEAALKSGKRVDNEERVFPSKGNRVLVHLEEAAAYPTANVIEELGTDLDALSEEVEQLARDSAALYKRRSDCSERYFAEFPKE